MKYAIEIDFIPLFVKKLLKKIERKKHKTRRHKPNPEIDFIPFVFK